jgi:hypothetical protein
MSDIELILLVHKIILSIGILGLGVTLYYNFKD